MVHYSTEHPLLVSYPDVVMSAAASESGEDKLEESGRGSSSLKRLVFAAAVGTTFGLMFLIGTLRVTELPPDGTGRGYVRTFSPPVSAFEVLLDASDGQAYATLALDPRLEHPEAFELGAPHAAYFARRPVIIYLLWVSTLGNRDLLAPAFVGLSALCAGIFVAVCTRWLQVRYPEADERLALMIIALPAVQTSLFFSTDLLGQGLGMLGYLLWHHRRRYWWAAACFVLAVLTRETTVIFAVASAVKTASDERKLPGRLWLLAGVPLAYGAWDLFVRSRLGPPGGAHNFSAPFVGIIRSVPAWNSVDMLMAVLGLGLLSASLIWRRRDDATWIAVAFGVFGLFLAAPVWGKWSNFSRVLLPVYVLPILGILGGYHHEWFTRFVRSRVHVQEQRGVPT